MVRDDRVLEVLTVQHQAHAADEAPCSGRYPSDISKAEVARQLMSALIGDVVLLAQMTMQ